MPCSMVAEGVIGAGAGLPVRFAAATSRFVLREACRPALVVAVGKVGEVLRKAAVLARSPCCEGGQDPDAAAAGVDGADVLADLAEADEGEMELVG